MRHEERYEAACEQVRAENERYLDIFERDLTGAGLARSTINRHLDNVSFYLNDFLLYYDINRMEDGCAQVNGFLGDFFIRKCMWSTPAAIRQYCASLKKFYKSMLGAGLIQGDENGLTPTATAIRAQIAAVLMRFCENVAK